MLLILYFPELALTSRHLVDLPQLSGPLSAFTSPDWSGLQNSKIFIASITLAVVASLETLLSIEATDKLDPYRRVTPLNRELKAQGITNIISGFLGGLPVTSVIVRSTANISAGAQSKISALYFCFLNSWKKFHFQHLQRYLF
jgi:MFS superfamily sulfate permease-like transporter